MSESPKVCAINTAPVSHDQSRALYALDAAVAAAVADAKDAGLIQGLVFSILSAHAARQLELLL